MAEYEQFTEWMRLEPVTDKRKQYKRLLTEKLKDNLVVLNQSGTMQVLNLSGSEKKFGTCLICYRHSKKPGATTEQWAKIKIDYGLSITDATHHSNCVPLTQREIAFQEFDRQCRKLVKENGLNHVLAYEKVNFKFNLLFQARTFCFHYHYLTAGAEPILVDDSKEPPEKRRRIEPSQLPNYDLSQALEGFIGRANGIKAYNKKC